MIKKTILILSLAVLPFCASTAGIAENKAVANVNSETLSIEDIDMLDNVVNIINKVKNFNNKYEEMSNKYTSCYRSKKDLLKQLASIKSNFNKILESANK